jgi:hypothetical protein
MWVPCFWVSVAANLDPGSPGELNGAIKVVGKCGLCGSKVERTLARSNGWQGLDKLVAEVARELVLSHVPNLPTDSN